MYMKHPAIKRVTQRFEYALLLRNTPEFTASETW